MEKLDIIDTSNFSQREEHQLFVVFKKKWDASPLLRCFAGKILVKSVFLWRVLGKAKLLRIL